MPTHGRACRHVQLQSTIQEIVLAPSISQAPGSRDMLRVTCVRGGVRCVLRGAGDCTMNMMFSATVSRLSTSTPLKRGTATMAAIMRKSSKPLHKRRVLTNWAGVKNCFKYSGFFFFVFFFWRTGLLHICVCLRFQGTFNSPPGERGCRWLTWMDAFLSLSISRRVCACVFVFRAQRWRKIGFTMLLKHDNLLKILFCACLGQPSHTGRLGRIVITSLLWQEEPAPVEEPVYVLATSRFGISVNYFSTKGPLCVLTRAWDMDWARGPMPVWRPRCILILTFWYQQTLSW